MNLSKKDYESLASFRYVLRKFLRFSEEAAAERGLSPVQHQALLAIQGYPGRSEITVSELAERLQIEHHSAVGLVDRLVQGQLVRRAADAVDRRRVNVSLTPQGLKILQQLAQVHRRELKRTGPGFRAALEKLEAEISTDRADGKQ